MIEIFKKNKALIFCFFICIVYWTYLFFFSSMEVVFDAIGYEDLGRLIYKNGLMEALFRQGPTREPLYPLSIAVSMYFAETLHVSYQKIQTVFQIIILFCTQILALKIMMMCAFKKWAKLLAALYLGFSPAIVNAGFSLFSEILAMPFVLLIVIFVIRFLREAHIGNNTRSVFMSILLSLAFIGAICVKAVFQYIFYFFILIIFAGVIKAAARNQKEVMKNMIQGVLIMCLLVGGFVNGYKYLNKIYNGKFDFTNRYDVLFFGTAYKRVQPLSRDVWLAHFASIPGNKFCESIVANKEACFYPQFHYGDAIWPMILPPLLAGVPEDKVPSKTVQLSFDEIKKNPAQYFFLTFLESFKMAFWESTQIGFVNYPSMVNGLFQNKLFKNGVRLVVSLLTYAGLFVAAFKIVRSRKKLVEFNPTEASAYALFCVLCIIFLFTGLYSIFAILSRFALPIAPLYVICIACFFDKIIFPKLKRLKVRIYEE